MVNRSIHVYRNLSLKTAHHRRLLPRAAITALAHRAYLQRYPKETSGLTSKKVLQHIELRAEKLQIRLQKSNVASHHADMENLLSPYPEITVWRPTPKIHGGLSHT